MQGETVLQVFGPQVIKGLKDKYHLSELELETNQFQITDFNMLRTLQPSDHLQGQPHVEPITVI